jgi:hypothetical protein
MQAFQIARIRIRSQAPKFIRLQPSYRSHSIPSGQIGEHLSHGSDQGSVLKRHGFSLSYQTSDVNSIHSEPASSFSSEQGSMFRQQIPRLLNNSAMKARAGICHKIQLQ